MSAKKLKSDQLGAGVVELSGVASTPTQSRGSREVGIHVVVEELATRGMRRTPFGTDSESRREWIAARMERIARVAVHPLLQQALVHRMAARKALMNGTAMYFNRFAPTLADCWKVLGSEYAVGTCRFDLVWERRDGMVVVDELKTGRNFLDTRDFRAQLEDYRQAAVDTWGERFLGIRVLILSGVPGRSFLLRADGSRGELSEVFGEH